MATEGGRAGAALSDLLLAEGSRFTFFQAVRLLQRMAPERAPVGTVDDPAREALRFRSEVSLNFPASEVAAIEPGGEYAPPRLTVRFLGAATPASFGSLPLPYTELILDRERERDPALRDFLDLFNHRLIALFYRAWEKYRFGMVYERAPDPAAGPFERALGALVGLGVPALRGRLPLDDRALLARAHAFGPGAIPAADLEDLIEGYFGVRVRVQQFLPGRYVAEPGERCRLGRANHALGRGASLGAEVSVAQSRFRLRLGPLDWEAFRDLLPGSAGHAALSELARLAAGAEYDMDLELILETEAVPRLRLGMADESGAPLLGWSTWLHARAPAGGRAAVVVPTADLARCAPTHNAGGTP
ncbi:MAG: type VI secretion system baseplate subunit TssG [Candidatus Krumholzibacteriota bacterium]|nr:type VI secretion system baseplate subunit TssG [Candidatus Krumholzibacteriota bacterium]